jgi:hypothetical protein
MSFRFSALSRDRFDPLFSMHDDALARRGARRVTATRRPGFPCRVTLQDAEIGEQVLLVNFAHLDVDTPFRSSHAIYVRQAGQPAQPAIDVVPDMLRTRTISLRAWTQEGMLAAAELAEGTDVERAIAALFSIPEAAFLHVHFANAGCYAARVDRA